MIYDWNFTKKIQCSNKDKEECLDLITTFTSLADKARKQGILALEDEIDDLPPMFLLRKGLQLAIDGTEPEMIRTILERYILVGNYKGKELLKRVIILEGVLSIQAGDNPSIIHLLLGPFFGENFVEEYIRVESRNNTQKYFESIKDSDPFSNETALLEDIINHANYY